MRVRTPIGRRLVAACALGIGLLLACPAPAAETLRVLTWPGYADPDLVRRFEARYKVKVDVRYVGSDDALREKIKNNNASDFDVFAANTAEMQFYLERRLIQPLRMANIPNTALQLPRFADPRKIPGIARAGEVYAIPYTYSEMGLIYDRRQLKEPPTSIDALWDPQYRGKVLAFDASSHNFSLASLALKGQPFRIDTARFNEVARHLIALRRNVLTFYTLPEESVELFRRHGAALMFANYGTQQVKLLRDAGADVGYVIPREGALAWLDCWAVTHGARNRRLAESFINFMLDKTVSTELTRRQGLSNTLEAGAASREGDRIIWLEPVEDDQRRAAAWAHIISGDLPGKF